METLYFIRAQPQIDSAHLCDCTLDMLRLLISRKHNHFEVNAVAYRIGLSKFNSPVVCFGGQFQGISVGIQLSAYSSPHRHSSLSTCSLQEPKGRRQSPVAGPLPSSGRFLG